MLFELPVWEHNVDSVMHHMKHNACVFWIVSPH